MLQILTFKLLKKHLFICLNNPHKNVVSKYVTLGLSLKLIKHSNYAKENRIYNVVRLIREEHEKDKQA